MVLEGEREREGGRESAKGKREEAGRVSEREERSGAVSYGERVAGDSADSDGDSGDNGVLIDVSVAPRYL